MNASDWAAWVGAIGTILAAGIAAWLYWRSRLDAKADIDARRRVLHGVLKEHVVGAADFVRVNTGRIRTKDFLAINSEFRYMLLSMPGVDRLAELQTRLLDFGEEGDADIARFIEACRQYHDVQSGWKSLPADEKMDAKSAEGEVVSLGVLVIADALEKVRSTVEPALKAIARYDKQSHT